MKINFIAEMETARIAAPEPLLRAPIVRGYAALRGAARMLFIHALSIDSPCFLRSNVMKKFPPRSTLVDKVNPGLQAAMITMPEQPSGADVKRFREAVEMTQEEFAKQFNLPLGTLRRWEQGQNEPRGNSPLHVAVRKVLRAAGLGRRPPSTDGTEQKGARTDNKTMRLKDKAPAASPRSSFLLTGRG